MARKVFYSFHFKEDSQRVSQVKQIGAIEGQPLLSSNQWEEIKKGGDKSDRTMDRGRDERQVLPGRADRHLDRWQALGQPRDHQGVERRQGRAWHLHPQPQEPRRTTVAKGLQPLHWPNDQSQRRAPTIVKTYDPPFSDSKAVYDHIKENIESWVEQAIEIRNNFTA